MWAEIALYGGLFSAFVVLGIALGDWVSTVIMRQHSIRRGGGIPTPLGSSLLMHDWEASRARSLELLDAHLSDAQRKQFNTEKRFTVIGEWSKKPYHIVFGDTFNVFLMKGKRRIGLMCVRPEASLPTGDVLLAQKIGLERNERATLAVANLRPDEGGEKDVRVVEWQKAFEERVQSASALVQRTGPEGGPLNPFQVRYLEALEELERFNRRRWQSRLALSEAEMARQRLILLMQTEADERRHRNVYYRGEPVPCSCAACQVARNVI